MYAATAPNLWACCVILRSRAENDRLASLPLLRVDASIHCCITVTNVDYYLCYVICVIVAHFLTTKQHRLFLVFSLRHHKEV